MADPAPARTPKYLLADLILEGKLEEFVASRRADGLAWRHVASALFEATEGKVDVTQETLRAWFPEDREDLAMSRPNQEPAA